MQDLALVAYAMMFGSMGLGALIGALVGRRLDSTRPRRGAWAGALLGLAAGGAAFIALARSRS